MILEPTSGGRPPPLEIAALEIAPGWGRLGVTAAPGRRDGDARDLGADLDVIAAWPARGLVSLIEAKEFARLGIESLGEEALRRGLDWLHLPIPDFGTPGAAFAGAWPAQSARLRAELASGVGIVLHCRGGLGRSGMVAARLLVESGWAPSLAVAEVRRVRPGAIETAAQEAWARGGALSP